MSEDKNISLNINLSKIGQWIRGHVLWTTSIVSGFILWRFLSTAWYMPESYWTGAKCAITILGSVLFTIVFFIVTGTAISEAYEKSKRERY